jgi:hypothetical protein
MGEKINVEDIKETTIVSLEEKTVPEYIFKKNEYENIESLIFAIFEECKVEWPGIVKFPKLDSLYFSGKNSSDFIKSFENHAYGLNNIKSVYIEGSGIQKVPSFIFNLPKLKELTFRYEHELREIPLKIFKLSSLTKLSFEYNRKIKVIPDEIKKLKNLERFNLWSANLEYISPELYLLPKLKYINLAYSHYKPLEDLLEKKGVYKPDNYTECIDISNYKKEIKDLAEIYNSKKK